MRTTAITIAIDDRLLPVIDELAANNEISCPNSYLSLLLTSALLEARVKAARQAAYEDAAMRAVGTDFDEDDEDDRNGTLH